MKNKLALILAVVLGLIAVYGFQKVLQNRQKQYQEKFKPQRIAAAGQHIPAGTVVTPQMLYKDDVDNLPGKVVTESAITADDIMADDLRFIGQPTNRTLERRDPLRWSYFRQPVEKLEQKLNVGERAITLRVDNVTGVAGNLVPGSRVDIIGTFPISTQQGAAARAPGAAAVPAGATASHTVLLLDYVRILAVDSRTRDEEYVISGGARVKSYSTITVAVSPLEANLLVYAQQEGGLTMSLRSPVADPKEVAAAQEVSDKNLLDLAAAARKEREERMKSAGPLEGIVP